MIDSLELVDQDRLGVGDVPERDGALAEVSVGQLSVDETVDEVADGLLRVVRERAGSRLDGVGHHEDGLFAGERIGSGVGEEQVVDVVVGMLVLVFDVEVFCLTLSVVGADELPDDRRQVVFFRQFESVGDMSDDDLRAVDVRHVLVWVDGRLVFGEIYRRRYLADVMIERARADELALCADLVGYRRSQIADLYGVLECARGHLAHASEQVVVGVGQFDERDVGGEAEHFFHEIEHGVGEEQQRAVDDDVVECAGVDIRQCRHAHHFVGHVHGHAHDGDDDGRLEELRAVLEFAERIDGRQARQRLHDDEVERKLQHAGADEYHREVGEEGRARVHEDADEDGHDGVGQDVDMADGVAHEQSGEHDEDDDERVEHRDASRLLEVVFSEEAQIDGEAEHEQRHIDGLAHRDQSDLARVAVSPFVLHLEGLDDAVGVFVDDVTPSDDFLSFLCHAAGQRHTVHEVGQTGFAARLVEDEVGRDVVVEVALLQGLTVLAEHLVEKELLVGALLRIYVYDTDARGVFSVDHAHHLRRVRTQLVVVGRVHDTPLIDASQPVGDDADIVVRHSGYALGEVGDEAAHLFPLGLFVETVVGFVLPHETVALLLDGLVRLVDGEVERCGEVGVTPGAALFDTEVCPAVVRHDPDNHGHGGDDDGHLDEQSAPGEVGEYVCSSHNPSVVVLMSRPHADAPCRQQYGKMVRKYKKISIFEG